MITSSNENIFRGTGPLCGEFTGLWWIPSTKASDAELWCFLDLHLIERLSKHSRGWWFETLSRPLWRHCNDLYVYDASCEFVPRLRRWIADCSFVLCNTGLYRECTVLRINIDRCRLLKRKCRYYDEIFITGCTEIVILTTYGATSVANFVKMTTCPFLYPYSEYWLWLHWSTRDCDVKCCDMCVFHSISRCLSLLSYDIWGFQCQKQVSKAWVCNYIIIFHVM